MKGGLSTLSLQSMQTCMEQGLELLSHCVHVCILSCSDSLNASYIFKRKKNWPVQNKLLVKYVALILPLMVAPVPSRFGIVASPLCCRPTSEGLVMDALATAHPHHHLPLPHDGPLWPEAYEESSSIWDETGPACVQHRCCSLLCLPSERSEW